MRIVERIFERVRRGLNSTGLGWMATAGRPAYHRLLRLLYPTGIPRYIHGESALFFSPAASDIPEDKDEASFRAMKHRIREGAVVLDIGANVGMYTLLLARWVGSAGKVFAFEPVLQTVDRLQQHVNMNQLTDRVEVVQAAVGNSVGEAIFYYAAKCPGHASFAASAVAGGEAQLVPVTTVDAFCQARGIVPTFLKIDVEGYEAHVLDGAQETIRRYTPDLLIETHPHHWQELGLSREHVRGRLASLTNLGYHVEDLDGAVNQEREAHLLYWHPVHATSLIGERPCLP